MTNHNSRLAVVIGAALLMLCADAAFAQAPVRALVQLQILITRTQGEKKIASMPHTLSVKPDASGRSRASLRQGAQVPIPTIPAADAKAAQPAFTYKDIGTSIDAFGTTLDDGRYELSISISESWVYAEGQAPVPQLRAGTPPVLRSYSSSNQAILRDGQTTEFTTSTDPITGEVVKVEVKLTVVK